MNTNIRPAEKAVDRLVEAVDDMQGTAAPKLQELAAKADALVQRGTEVLRDKSDNVRLQAQRASDQTIELIREEPVKAVLIAAAAGAAMFAVASLLLRAR